MNKPKLVMSADMAAEYALVQAVEYELGQMPCTGPVEVQLLNLSRLTFRHGDREVGVNVPNNGSYHLYSTAPGHGLIGVVFDSTKVEAAAEYICRFVLFGFTEAAPQEKSKHD